MIDLGPEGGEIVAWGPPEDIVKAPRSYTGSFCPGAGESEEAVEERGERGGGVERVICRVPRVNG